MAKAECKNCNLNAPTEASAGKPKADWEYECLMDCEEYPDAAHVCIWFTTDDAIFAGGRGD
uniref:Uncharacterized protein n=1 Tax=viral metagenome TaxID=1070528 RepID=A0A6M3IGD5_9ZZZZ